MSAPIDFYFDFASPYGYFAAQEIEAMAARHGRTVAWRPFLLGAAFKLSGQQPLASQPEIRGWYFPRDWDRIARMKDVPFTLPPGFPMAAVAPSRAFYWLHDQDAELAKRFAHGVYAAYFGTGRDMTGAEAVADVAETLGVDRRALLAALQDQAIKDRLKAEVDAALARKVFGSPTLVVDGEIFWGWDRLWMVDEWLARGGW